MDEVEEGEEEEVKSLDLSCWIKLHGGVSLLFSFADLAKHLGSKVKIPDFQTSYNYRNYKRLVCLYSFLFALRAW